VPDSPVPAIATGRPPESRRWSARDHNRDVGGSELGLEGESATDFSRLVDVSLIAEYGPSGDLDSLDVESAAKATATAEQDALIDEFAESGVGLESFATMFPDTPIGQGAVWTISESDNPVGASFPVQPRLTLVSLVGDDYTVELAIEGDPLELFETEATSSHR
jgi:hypothetical protein